MIRKWPYTGYYALACPAGTISNPPYAYTTDTLTPPITGTGGYVSYVSNHDAVINANLLGGGIATGSRTADPCRYLITVTYTGVCALHPTSGVTTYGTVEGRDPNIIYWSALNIAYGNAYTYCDALVVAPPGSPPGTPPVTPPPCVPELLFSDNFDLENNGTPEGNYAGFTHWDVPAGFDVDLINSDTYGGIPVEQGMVVDMFGTDRGTNGKITQKVNITYAAGSTYKLTFKVSENHANYYHILTLAFNIGSLLVDSITMENTPEAPLDFETIIRTFSPSVTTSAKLTFLCTENGASDRGIVVDDIVIERICS